MFHVILFVATSGFVVPPPTVRSLVKVRESPEYYKGMMTSPVTAEDAKKDMLTPTLKLAGGTSLALVVLLALFFASNASAADFEPRGVTPLDTGVFVLGTVPFVWAANEFWRRIAGGESFGTGSDSVVIAPDDDQVRRFGGRRVLGQDALIAARALMGIALFSVILTIIAAFQIK